MIMDLWGAVWVAQYSVKIPTICWTHFTLTQVGNEQPYHPAAQDWSPTEAKQGWAWLVPGWETSGENQVLLKEVLVRPAGGAHPVVYVGPNAPV